MEPAELQHIEAKFYGQTTLNKDERQDTTSVDRKQAGGWITFPFFIGTVTGLSLATGGWVSNLIVFLITELNVKSIKATQINNIVLGCFSLFPIAGAILADSFLSFFSVITIFSLVSLLGVIMLTLITLVHSLRPPACITGSLTCEAPSKLQYAVLYGALTLASIGLGGTRFTMATMGATQFDKPNDQAIFFNWFLNNAALKIQYDSRSEGSYATSGKQCTVEEVEALKTIIKIIPLWSTGIFLATPIGIFNSLIVLEALTMDRHLGPHFQIPAGSFLVFNLVATAISILVIDRFLISTWQNLTRRPLTLLQRVGFGHVFNIAGMVGAALIEIKRLHVVRAHRLEDEPGRVMPMSALWLVVPLTIVGIGEAFHFPGQVAFYYQEFPISLRSTSTAMVSLLIGLGFYLTTAIVDLIRHITGWLPDNINKGRVDNVFWMLAVIGVVNFGYYLACAKLFKYQNVEKLDGISRPFS